jgi:Arf/Sar family protein
MRLQTIVNDPLMRNSAVLVLANKQDLPGAMSTSEVVEYLGLPKLKGRHWNVQSAVATRGTGLYEVRVFYHESTSACLCHDQ